MILSKNKILEERDRGNIFYKSDLYKLDDFVNNQSVDIHLGEWIAIPNNGQYDWHDITKPLYIKKGTFFLTHSEEFIGTTASSNLHPQFHQRSTLARMGLLHTKAGWGDVGYKNRWTMEFFTAQDMTIQAGMRVAQISFTRVEGEPENYETNGNYVSKEWKKEDILPKINNY